MLYQGWAKTTGAENMFWGHEPAENYSELVNVFAMGENDTKVRVAEYLNEADAGWITAVHGCFGDLIKRWHDALETAERMECERDQAVSELVEAHIEIEKLEQGK